MTVRRADFWSVKPGRMDEFVSAFNDVKQAMSAHIDPVVRLMVVGHGQAGPYNLTSGHSYVIADFDSCAAYGNFLHAAAGDDAIQTIWTYLHSADSPVIHRGTGLLQRVYEGGAPAPSPTGSVALVRAWKIEPGMMHVAQAASRVVDKRAEAHGGHVQALRPMLVPSGGPNVIVSHTFPDWRGLGAFLDDLNDDPEIQTIAESFRSATPTGHLVQAHTASTIAF